MLIKRFDKASGKVLRTSRSLLIDAKDGYVRPAEGRDWFATTMTVWRVDELIKRRVRDWRRLTEETGHSGERTGTMRKDHDTVYTGTHSVFPAPLMEWIILRYGGPQGGTILDAFAGGPPRGMVSSIMGHKYTGVEIRKEQIAENERVLKRLKLNDNANYVLDDGCYLDFKAPLFDAAITCPPYFNLEVYSDHPKDVSNVPTYTEFDAAMFLSAKAHRRHMKPGSYVCWIVGNFRSKRDGDGGYKGELIDFRSHTVDNFQRAGFIFHQEIILSKNFGSAAKRSTNAWKGHKLVPIHEFLLVFKTPGEPSKPSRVRLNPSRR